MKSIKKSLVYSVLAIIAVLAVATIGGSFYLLNYALASKPANRTPDMKAEISKYPELKTWVDSLNNVKALRDTFVVMPSGERQHAIFVNSPRANGHTAVVVHGYGCYGVEMLHIAYIYEKAMGYNVILPDLHGHGLSDGNDIQMGWNDRLDVLQWAAIAERLFNEPGVPAKMVVHGISMGAATTMNVAGEQTPDYIKCFVEDCGYASAWDEFSHELKGQFSLPDFPLLYAASALCKMKYGWSFSENSSLKQVAKCRKPMLFIHGSNDTYVPTEMVYPLYAAKPQPKQLWIANGSKHALSYKDHKAEYTRRVTAFVSRWNR
jgi:uncharacterized protein